MSAVDEARALVAVLRREAIACRCQSGPTRAFMTAAAELEAHAEDAAALLVRLCDEVDALRAADVAHERRHALSERGDGYADRVIAELRAERDALRAALAAKGESE